MSYWWQELRKEHSRQRKHKYQDEKEGMSLRFCRNCKKTFRGEPSEHCREESKRVGRVGTWSVVTVFPV